MSGFVPPKAACGLSSRRSLHAVGYLFAIVDAPGGVLGLVGGGEEAEIPLIETLISKKGGAGGREEKG